MTHDNRKYKFVTWPAIVKCDPQLSNLQHAVRYSKDGILRIPEFYHSEEELFVEQLLQFCFSKLSFQKTRFVNFFTYPVLPNSLYDNVSILFVRHILSSDHVKWANNENEHNLGIAGTRVCLTSNIDLQLSHKWFIYIFPLS